MVVAQGRSGCAAIPETGAEVRIDFRLRSEAKIEAKIERGATLKNWRLRSAFLGRRVSRWLDA